MKYMNAHRGAMQTGSGRVRLSRYGFALALLMLLALPGLAQAACSVISVPSSITTPSTSPMTSGGAITIHIGELCNGDGINAYDGSWVDPSHGSIIVHAIVGDIIYTNNGDGATSDSFVAFDSTGHPFTVNIAIAPASVSAPVAAAVNASVAFNSSNNTIALALSGGTATSVSVASSPGHGTATASGTSISYTPTSGYYGTDSFTYTASNSGGTSAPATIFVTINSPPAPTVANTSASAAYGTATTVDLNGSISGVDITGISIGTAPSHGMISAINVAGKTMTYTPTPGFIGVDSFTYTATNPGGTSAAATVTVTVTAPTITLTPSTLPSGTVASGYSQSLSASGGALPYIYSVTAGNLPVGLTLNPDGTLSGTPTEGGTFNIMVRATDAFGQSGSRSYTLNIGAPSINLSPGSLPVPVYNTSYSQSVSASGGVTPYHYAVTAGLLPMGFSLNATTGLISGTPSTTGQYSFTVTATGSATGTGPYSGSQTYSGTIAAPVITLAPVTLPSAQAGVAFSQTLSATGGAGPYTYAVTAGSLPANASLATDGTLSGTPGAAGTFNFTVTATDANNHTGSLAYTWTVNLPAAPTVAAKSVSTAYNTAAQINLSGSISGVDITAVTIGSGPAHGTVTVSGETVTYTPASTYYGGADSFTYTATNPGGTSAPATVSITVGLPSAPTTAPKSVTTPYNTAAQIDLTGSITGVDITAVTIGSGPAHGTVTVSGQTVTYTPASTYYGGADSFTYTATNPGGTSAPATVNITVGLPSAPTVAAKTINTPYNTAAQIDLSGSITGVDITAVTIGSGPAHGTVTVSGQTVTYTPASTYYGGADSFTYTATNPGGTSTPATVSITVGLPSAPTVAAKTINTPYNTAAQIDLTGSITGVDITAVTIGSGPAHGTVTVSGQTVTYTPASTYYGGADSFTYTATNPGGTSAPATVNITVGLPSAPTTAPKSVSTPYNTAAQIDLTGSISGVDITAVTIGSGPAHGTVTVSGQTVTYTPASTYYGGADSFTYTATNPGGTSAPATVSITVGLPSAPTVAAKTINTPYNTAAQIDLTSSITGVDVTAVTIATAPTHGTVTLSGQTVTYTPASTYYGGADSFTYTATNPGGTSAPATVSITVGHPSAPTVVAKTVSTVYNTSAQIDLSASITGVDITSVAIASAPGHGTVTVSGQTVTYTPSSTYYQGSDSFTYTATNPGGTSAPAKVTVKVTPLAVPVAKPQQATVLAGKTATFDTTQGATGGPFTTAAVTTAPAFGTTSVAATKITYAAPADASGKVSFAYTLSNHFGTSKPVQVTVTVNPLPVAPSLTAKVLAGSSVQLDLTAKAHGGPFIGAKVVSIQPTAAGTASIKADNGGYTLSFRAASDFSGQAQLTYTLSNAYATSAPGSVRISVVARPDPSKDPEVLGILAAQANATRRLARGQIDNFQQRLESLHDGSANRAGFSNGMRLNVMRAFRPLERGRRHPNDQRSGPSADWSDSYLERQPRAMAATKPKPDGSRHPLPGGLSVWTGGAVNFGRSTPGTDAGSLDFTTAGITVGADQNFGKAFTIGAGIGYGHDLTDVGHNGSRSSADSYNAAVYASYHPNKAMYVDGLIGYQWLSFESHRYLTANGGRVYGKRDGKQWFGSLSVGYAHQGKTLRLTPYARLDVAHARLDGYTEKGDPIYALTYGEQTVDTTTGSLGLRMLWSVKRDYGIWMPSLKFEYRHDFQGSSTVALRYADLLQGPIYRAKVPELSHNHALLGVGIGLQTLHGWTSRFVYQNLIDSSSHGNQSVLLHVEKSFPP